MVTSVSCWHTLRIIGPFLRLDEHNENSRVTFLVKGEGHGDFGVKKKTIKVQCIPKCLSITMIVSCCLT